MPKTARKGLLPLFYTSLLILLTLPSGSFAEIVLTEILAAPGSDWSGDGEIDWRDDEWVEIANRGDSPVDLSDYWVSDELGDSPIRYRFSGTLQPNEAMYVTGQEAREWQLEMGLGGAGLSLRNTDGDVVLYQDIGDSVRLADVISYRSYQVEYERAMGRHPLESEDWILFDGLNLYHGSQQPGTTGCIPSPGVINDCGDVGVGELDWGNLKGLYGLPEA
jgi:hypothetical protein